MEMCKSCNWTRHPVSAHEKLCPQGHPIDIVGRYSNGYCRACQRSASRAYRAAHLETERERVKKWDALHRVRSKRARAKS